MGKEYMLLFFKNSLKQVPKYYKFDLISLIITHRIDMHCILVNSINGHFLEGVDGHLS